MEELAHSQQVRELNIECVFIEPHENDIFKAQVRLRIKAIVYSKSLTHG